MKADWLIVGAGFTGAVLAERLASQLNRKVVIVDSRSHISGNAYDFLDEHGVLVHKYGPHIFHTNSQLVWHYLSQFTGWRTYYHRSLVSIQGKKVPLPFNLNSLHALFPASNAAHLEKLLIAIFGLNRRIPLQKLYAAEHDDIRALAAYIYEHIFRPYTIKHWGVEPAELDPSVLARVPIHISRDDRYFPDLYQAMPDRGYTRLFERILAHPNIQIVLNSNLTGPSLPGISFHRMIYTGPIDAFFNYCYGPLPYRSATFEFQHLPQPRYQGAGIVNYPNGTRFTRITELKYLTGQKTRGTTIGFEYPEPYRPGENFPLYPVPQSANHALYERYRELAVSLADRIIFAGRLADYKYYNMDQAAARALKLFHDIAQSHSLAPLALIGSAS